MTQKEYIEEISKYQTLLGELDKKLEEERLKNYDYEQVLKDYHIANEDLKRARETIRDLNTQLLAKQEIIERYDVLIGRLNINC